MLKILGLLLSVVSLHAQEAPESIAIEENKTASRLEKQFLSLANTLSRVRTTQGPCDGEVEARLQDIAYLVREAQFYYNENKEFNLESDKEFKPQVQISKALKDTVSLREMFGYLPLEDASLFAEGLQGAILWGPAPGAYDNMSFIKFLSTTQLELHTREYGFFGESIWHKKAASYSLENFTSQSMKVVIYPDGEGPTEYQLRRYGNEPNRQWVMIPVTNLKADPFLEGYVEFPRECGY